MQARRDTLATFDIYQAALPSLQVDYQPIVNPPLWELGHVGWFQDWWLGRNPLRHVGCTANPNVARAAARRSNADALYDSSRVPHENRWTLPLPDASATRADLAQQLDHSLSLLDQADDDNPGTLYFFRLVLLHEDMHHEAAVYMTQTLDLDHPDERWWPRTLPAQRQDLRFEPSTWTLGNAQAGFVFDNELGLHSVAVGACRIDSRAVNWAEYIAFIDAGGYTDARLWSPAGWRWLQGTQRHGARDLRRGDHLSHAASDWQQRRGSRWQGVNPLAAASHLNLHEAQAWCRWAQRRLPSEAEWERAAIEQPEAFHWGQVWEWTASPFSPYPGFTAHPYRDYSQPWFDGRPVLKGASHATQPRMQHPRYRNYFSAERCDVVTGFRTCAL